MTTMCSNDSEKDIKVKTKEEKKEVIYSVEMKSRKKNTKMFWKSTLSVKKQLSFQHQRGLTLHTELILVSGLIQLQA